MSDAYLGNPNLKKVNTPVEFTKEQVIEFRKCENDPLYFISKYVQIVSLDEGLVPFNISSRINPCLVIAKSLI